MHGIGYVHVHIPKDLVSCEAMVWAEVGGDLLGRVILLAAEDRRARAAGSLAWDAHESGVRQT